MVHFTQPPGASLNDPASWDAGLLLGMSFIQLFFLSNLLSSFSCILMIGIVLAIARYKTMYCLSVGLHTGWVTVYKVYQGDLSNPEIQPSILVGMLIRDGLFALAFLLITLGLMLHYVKRFHGEKVD